MAACSEVAGLCSLVERFELLETRPPLPEAIGGGAAAAAAVVLVEPGRAEGAERAGGRAAPLCGEHLQGVEGSRLGVLVGVADDLAQVARQVLAGEGQALAGQLLLRGGPAAGALALGRRAHGGHVAPEQRGGGGRRGSRGRTRGGRGGHAAAAAGPGAGGVRLVLLELEGCGRLAQRVLLVLVVVELVWRLLVE